MNGPEILLVVALGIAVGLLSAAFGVGGGVLMVPFIVLVFDETQQLAEGTSLLVIVPTAIAGVISHARGGLVDFRTAGAIAIGGVAGAIAGALLALSISSESLQTAFGTAVVLVGVTTIARGVKGKKTET